jgi:hypothetical protein
MPIALTQFSSRNNRSALRLLLALGSMFASAYCFFGWMGAVGWISGWIGRPQNASLRTFFQSSVVSAELILSIPSGCTTMRIPLRRCSNAGAPALQQ